MPGGHCTYSITDSYITDMVEIIKKRKPIRNDQK